MAEWLQTLERDQIDKTGRWDGARIESYPVTTAMAMAGVMMASSIAGPLPGTVSLIYATEIPSRPIGDPNHVSDAVTIGLTLRKHVEDTEKLDASGVAVRHLFLWIDPLTCPDIGRALSDGIPGADPHVDPRITEIWLGLPACADNQVLRWSESAGWRFAKVAAQR